MTTATQRVSAKLMREAGHSYEQIGAFFGVKADTARVWFDKEFARNQASKFKAKAFRKKKGW